MRELLINRIMTPDGTILQSSHQHDYKIYTDKISNEVYVNDGGTSYIRRSVNKVPYADISLYTDSPFKELREAISWGTYGKNGDQGLQRKAIKELSSQHIQAILTNCGYISKGLREVFERELVYRSESEIKEEHWEEL